MLLDSLRYCIHVAFHPFDGFWDLKHEKRGNAKAATILVFLVVLSRVFKRQATGFIFNFNDVNTLNLGYEFRLIAVSLFMWVIANWCLTTLMDGEGSLKDIYITTAYALTPFILVYIPLTIISNYLITEEGAFYNFFNMLPTVWFCLLLFIGIMIVHQYSIKKTVLTIFLTLVGIGIIIFLGLLFVNLLEDISNFVLTLYQELVFRLY